MNGATFEPCMNHPIATSWAERLQECERLLARPPSRLTWLRRAYVRMYRFLLAQYGDRATLDGPESSMPFIDATESLSGKAARTRGEILHTLKQIHAAVPGIAAGDLQEDTEDAWIVVVTKTRRQDLPAMARLMKDQGIPARILKIGGQPTLQVPMAWRHEAFALLPTLHIPPWQVRRPAPATLPTLPWRAFSLILVVFCLVSTIFLLDMLPALRWWEVAGLIVGMEVVLGLAIGVATGAFQQRSP